MGDSRNRDQLLSSSPAVANGEAPARKLPPRRSTMKAQADRDSKFLDVIKQYGEAKHASVKKLANVIRRASGVLVDDDNYHLAALSGKLDIVKRGVEKDRSIVHKQFNFSKESLLSSAERSNEHYIPPPPIPKLVRMSLLKPAEQMTLDQRWLVVNSFSGSTLLHYACAGDQLEVVKYLLVMGSNPYAENDVQKTAEAYTTSSDVKQALWNAQQSGTYEAIGSASAMKRDGSKHNKRKQTGSVNFAETVVKDEAQNSVAVSASPAATGLSKQRSRRHSVLNNASWTDNNLRSVVHQAEDEQERLSEQQNEPESYASNARPFSATGAAAVAAVEVQQEGEGSDTANNHKTDPKRSSGGGFTRPVSGRRKSILSMSNLRPGALDTDREEEEGEEEERVQTVKPSFGRPTSRTPPPPPKQKPSKNQPITQRTTTAAGAATATGKEEGEKEEEDAVSLQSEGSGSRGSVHSGGGGMTARRRSRVIQSMRMRGASIGGGSTVGELLGEGARSAAAKDTNPVNQQVAPAAAAAGSATPATITTTTTTSATATATALKQSKTQKPSLPQQQAVDTKRSSTSIAKEEDVEEEDHSIMTMSTLSKGSAGRRRTSSVSAAAKEKDPKKKRSIALTRGEGRVGGGATTGLDAPVRRRSSAVSTTAAAARHGARSENHASNTNDKSKVSVPTSSRPVVMRRLSVNSKEHSLDATSFVITENGWVEEPAASNAKEPSDQDNSAEEEEEREKNSKLNVEKEKVPAPRLTIGIRELKDICENAEYIEEWEQKMIAPPPPPPTASGTAGSGAGRDTSNGDDDEGYNEDEEEGGAGGDATSSSMPSSSSGRGGGGGGISSLAKNMLQHGLISPAGADGIKEAARYLAKAKKIEKQEQLELSRRTGRQKRAQTIYMQFAPIELLAKESGLLGNAAEQQLSAAAAGSDVGGEISGSSSSSSSKEQDSTLDGNVNVTRRVMFDASVAPTATTGGSGGKEKEEEKQKLQHAVQTTAKKMHELTFREMIWQRAGYAMNRIQIFDGLNNNSMYEDQRVSAYQYGMALMKHEFRALANVEQWEAIQLFEEKRLKDLSQNLKEQAKALIQSHNEEARSKYDSSCSRANSGNNHSRIMSSPTSSNSNSSSSSSSNSSNSSQVRAAPPPPPPPPPSNTGTRATGTAAAAAAGGGGGSSVNPPPPPPPPPLT